MFSSIAPQPQPQPQQPQHQSEIAPALSKEEEKSHPVPTPEDQLIDLWNVLISTSQSSIFSSKVKQYCLVLLSSGDEELFLNYFIENKFMTMLSQKVKEHKQDGQVLRTVFALFEFLLKALKKEEELVYFLVKISQEGFITEDYLFQEEEDEAYYANFLKLMVRTINAQPKFLNVFFNSREPHFPLLLQLLKMYDCKDTIMQTSSQLAVLQISNNKESLLQQYLSNFPFVLFYPLYASRLLRQFKDALEQQQSGCGWEGLQSSLRYLEDFLEKKDRMAIDMFTNSFLKMVGRYVYEELSTVQEKNVANATKIMKILLAYVLPEVAILKIRIGLLCLFAPKISVSMKKCYEAKPIDLEHKYWIPETCSQEVVTHCRAVFYREEPQNKSFFKSINSYIPRTKDNWLYHEIKKMGDIIGFNAALNEPITPDKHQNQSFLGSLEIMMDDDMVANPLLLSFCKANNQEMLYYYLKVLVELCDLQQGQQLLDFQQLTQVMFSCTSLSLLQMFNNLVVKCQLTFQHSEYLQEVYEKVTEKIIHFVLTRGWKELHARIKDCRLPEYDQQFSTDIYRQIECEILLFVSLRTLLGTKNSECAVFDPLHWEDLPSTLIETIFKCYDSGRYGPLVYMILDGQFLTLKNSQEKLINKQELLLTQTQMVVTGELLEIVGPYFSVSVYLESNLREYMLREVDSRKEMTDRVALELKGMRFEFSA